MQNDSEIVTRGILKEELSKELNKKFTKELTPIKESISRIASLALYNEEKIKHIEKKLDKLDKVDQIHTILDKMANDFYTYRQQQELAHGHLSEHWIKIEENRYTLQDHEGRIRNLEINS